MFTQKHACESAALSQPKPRNNSNIHQLIKDKENVAYATKFFLYSYEQSVNYMKYYLGKKGRKKKKERIKKEGRKEERKEGASKI